MSLCVVLALLGVNKQRYYGKGIFLFKLITEKFNCTFIYIYLLFKYISCFESISFLFLSKQISILR